MRERRPTRQYGFVFAATLVMVLVNVLPENDIASASILCQAASWRKLSAFVPRRRLQQNYRSSLLLVRGGGDILRADDNEDSSVDDFDEDEYLNYFNQLAREVESSTLLLSEDEPQQQEQDDNNDDSSSSSRGSNSGNDNSSNIEVPPLELPTKENRQPPLESSTKPESEESNTERRRLRKFRLEQQHLMQLRSIFLSEALIHQGIPLTSMVDALTPEGDTIPKPVDWDCCMVTKEEPKTCLISFDAEPNTKVVAPIDTDKWISLTALNRMRRTDPSKVENMWHNQYTILESWFGENSEYSMLQHVGFQGFLLSLLLKGPFLKILLSGAILAAFLVFLPVIEYVTNRLLVSGFLWMQWPTWARFVHAALPLKLFLAQYSWKVLEQGFGHVEHIIRERIIEWECQMLEQCVPVTVGPGSEPPAVLTAAIKKPQIDETRISDLINDEEDERVDELVSSIVKTDEDDDDDEDDEDDDDD